MLCGKDIKESDLAPTSLSELNLKFPEGLYKLQLLFNSYIVADPQHLREFYSAPEDDLSLPSVLVNILQLQYTFGKNVAINDYHVSTARMQLSRHISELMPDIVDELEAALNDEIVVMDGKFNPSLIRAENRMDPDCLL